jgi:hypothetical protein
MLRGGEKGIRSTAHQQIACGQAVLFRESRDSGEKRDLLETLVIMDSEAVWDIIDATLENEQ